jgi:ribosomal protein S8
MYTQLRLNLMRILEGLQKKKTFVILTRNPGTLELVNILLDLGYIHSYALMSSHSIKVFFKHGPMGGSPCNLYLTRKIFMDHPQLKILSSFNPRVILLILTPKGISFTKNCLHNKSSGFLLAEIY